MFDSRSTTWRPFLICGPLHILNHTPPPPSIVSIGRSSALHWLAPYAPSIVLRLARLGAVAARTVWAACEVRRAHLATLVPTVSLASSDIRNKRVQFLHAPVTPGSVAPSNPIHVLLYNP